jgi:hypothetical protein
MTTTNTEPGQLADQVWHSADSDPFAQFVEDEDSDTGLAPIEDAAEQAEAWNNTKRAIYELRRMAGRFVDCANAPLIKGETEPAATSVRFMYGKCAQELNQRADELAGGAR